MSLLPCVEKALQLFVNLPASHCNRNAAISYGVVEISDQHQDFGAIDTKFAHLKAITGRTLTSDDSLAAPIARVQDFAKLFRAFTGTQ